MNCNIVVDSREYVTGQTVVNAVKELGCSVLISTLAIGDYVISSSIAVERKRAMDLINSIIDGRLFEQANALTETYQEPYIIIEGDLWGAVSVRGISSNAVLGALVKLARSGVRLLWSSNEEGTAYILYSLATASHGSIRVISKRKKSDSIRDAQVSLLASLPGIGVKRAIKLLRIYGTPLNALMNFRQWRNKIDGLTPLNMAMIRRILETNFNGGRSNSWSNVNNGNSPNA